MPRFVFILLVVSELAWGGGGNSAFSLVEVCVCGGRGDFSFFMVFLKMKFRIRQLHTFLPFSKCHHKTDFEHFGQYFN